VKRLLFILLFFIFNGWEKQSSAASLPGTGIFYSSLSPHGEWIEVEPGFRVWHPLYVSHNWRPYLLGRWIWTEYGWYWMSNEPFGWITYHYGRWYYDDYYGWIWIPDDVWGPAWVEWRYDDSYIGWAPLPPYAIFNVTIGIQFTQHWEAPVHYWSFIPYHRFGSEIRYRDTAPEHYTRRLIGSTRSGSHYVSDHDRVVNRGVDRSFIERHGNLRIARTDIRESTGHFGENIIRSGRDRRIDHVEVYRLSRSEMHGSDISGMRRGERPLSIDMSKIERPRSEPRSPAGNNPRMETEGAGKSARSPDIQHGNRQQEQPRENKPQLQGKKIQRDRQTMRRELIQRYERSQNPSPPVNRTEPPSRKESRRDIIPERRGR
jgi:hypothetical protein